MQIIIAEACIAGNYISLTVFIPAMILSIELGKVIKLYKPYKIPSEEDPLHNLD